MKIISFLLMIILCFSLLGCGITEQESTAQTTQQTTAMTDAPTEMTNPTSAPAETTKPSVAPTQGNTGGGDVSLLGVSSLEEYEKHFTENRGYPDSFITFEDLQAWGNFESFICQSYNLMEGARKEYTVYEYGLIAGGGRFKFKFRPAKYEPDSVKSIEWVDITDTMIKSDLRTNEVDVWNGRVICGEYGYEYQYLGGKLYTVQWTTGETLITIWFLDGLDGKWPENDPDTLIGRMLIWDTAEEALDELREKIDGKLKDLKYPD